ADDKNPLEECFREDDYEEFLEIAKNGLEGWYANLGPMRYPVKPSEEGKHDDIFAYEKFDEIVGGMDKKFWEDDGIHGGKETFCYSPMIQKPYQFQHFSEALTAPVGR
uniref:L-amino-acid oxidase (Fragments) n=1 Tax=Macrovipera lebetinus TaxID=3148341 RepID=OXLA_MACLB|nr:RecName: Full=L-amino-acid oxidase; Short=LAAO; Short=LAO [Macrovipera lebetina]